MPLSRQQQVVLLETAEVYWVEAQEIKHGYIREFTNNSRMSGYLKRGTFGAAILTAIATGCKPILPRGPD
jgi:hypothetical protein